MDSNANINSIPCADSGLKELCSKYARMLPCCDGVRPKDLLYSQRSKILRGKADWADLFELKDELLKTGQFTFKVASWCMFPVFKKGDILKIAPASAGNIKKGDVPVYRNNRRLYAHRVVDKESADGKIHIITRPDTATDTNPAGEGERVPEEEILGVVKEIKRGGRILPVKKRLATAREAFWHRKMMSCLRSTALLKKSLEVTCVKFQSLKLYRLIGKGLAIGTRPYLSFELALPFSNKFDQVYNHLPLKDDKKILFSKIRKSRIFYLVLKLGNTSIGYLNFLNRPGNCPYGGLRISDVYIRLRYRELGFDSVLLKKAKGILEDMGC